MKELGIDTLQNESASCQGACAQDSISKLRARLRTKSSDLLQGNNLRLRLMENEYTSGRDEDTRTKIKAFSDLGQSKHVDTSKTNPQTGTTTKTEDEPKGKETEPANHEASIELGAAAQQTELGAATNQKTSTELGATASRDPWQIKLGAATNQKASIEMGAAASRDPQIELSCPSYDYEDICTSAKDNSPQERPILFNFCLGGNDNNKELKPKTLESDVKAVEKKESTLPTSQEQPRKFPPPQISRRPLQSGDFSNLNYLPRQKSQEDDDLEERVNSAPEARSHHHQEFFSLNSSRRFPQISQPIRFQSTGQYYHKMKEFRNRNLRQNVAASMHESLIPERPTESFSNHQPRQYHSAPAPLNSSPEETAPMARSSSERTLTSLPVVKSSTTQAEGFNFASMSKSSPPSTNQKQDPSSGDVVPSSSAGRLVTDHAPAPAIPIEPSLGASGNSDSEAAADIVDFTISDSKPNLTQKDEVDAAATALPEPQDQVTSRNGSGENDLETDGSIVHVTHNDVLAAMLRDEDIVEDPAADNTTPDQTCHSAPELTRNLEERTPERNAPNENTVPSTNDSTSAASRTQVRSMSSSEPLSGQNRRLLRAQRRNRLRQARNRSPSNRPPDGAEAASNRTHSRRSHNNNQSAAAANDIVERFGLIVSEDEDENLDPEEIRKENQRLKNARLCQVCKDKDANRLFLPCAHLSSCSLCSPALTKCPQCKANIRGIVSVYFG